MNENWANKISRKFFGIQRYWIIIQSISFQKWMIIYFQCISDNNENIFLWMATNIHKAFNVSLFVFIQLLWWSETWRRKMSVICAKFVCTINKRLWHYIVITLPHVKRLMIALAIFHFPKETFTKKMSQMVVYTLRLIKNRIASNMYFLLIIYMKK